MHPISELKSPSNFWRFVNWLSDQCKAWSHHLEYCKCPWDGSYWGKYAAGPLHNWLAVMFSFLETKSLASFGNQVVWVAYGHGALSSLRALWSSQSHGWESCDSTRMNCRAVQRRVGWLYVCSQRSLVFVLLWEPSSENQASHKAPGGNMENSVNKSTVTNGSVNAEGKTFNDCIQLGVKLMFYVLVSYVSQPVPFLLKSVWAMSPELKHKEDKHELSVEDETSAGQNKIGKNSGCSAFSWS